MNRRIISISLFSAFALSACFEGDGGPDVTHAEGTWQLNWTCEQAGETLTGCEVGQFYPVSAATDTTPARFGATWPGSQSTGTLQGNALSVVFDYGAQNAPGYYREEAVYYFDRTNQDTFDKVSSYSGSELSGSCTGKGTRVPSGQVECMPL